MPRPHRHVPHPPRDPRPPTTVTTRLTWAACHATDGTASQRVGVGPRPIAWSPPQERRSVRVRWARAAERAREAGSRPCPCLGAAPRPRHLGEPRPVSATWGSPAPAAAVRTRSPGTAAPPSFPPGLSVAPLHFRRGTPAPVLAHLTRTQFRAFRGLSHSLHQNSRG